MQWKGTQQFCFCYLQTDERTDTMMLTGAFTQIFPANMLTGDKLTYRQTGIDSCTEYLLLPQ